MIVNMIVFKDKGYRIFYSTELGQYIMGCTKAAEKIEENFFEITSGEYDEWCYNPVHLNWFAELFSFYGEYCYRACNAKKTKILKAELKEYAKKGNHDRIRIVENSEFINSEERLIRNDFRTLCLIAKINALARKFKSGVVPFTETEDLNEERLIYDDEDVMFDNGNLQFFRLIDGLSEDASGLWIESFYDESDFSGMECFLVIEKNGRQYIRIAVQNEPDTIEINEDGEWVIMK